MTPQDEAYEKICDFLKYRPEFRSCFEFEHVFAFRVHPGQRLCVIKKTGKVAWEDDLSDDVFPTGAGKQIPLWDHL